LTDKTVLAFDLGASNGRAILGYFRDQKIEMEIVHKFANQAVEVRGAQYWDILHLFNQMKTGLQKAAQKVKIDSIGIDSWAVDYALLDRGDNLLSNPYFYRDNRTEGLVEEVTGMISRSEIYEKTGIQFMPINTLYQLYADKKYRPWVLDEANSLLFIPDLLNFFFTGEKCSEYTNASTSQFFNPQTEQWETSILEKLDLPTSILEDIVYPTDRIGMIREEIKKDCSISYNIPVYAVASHDTASAVAATPLKDPEHNAYLSSGTWSLLGMELPEPLISEQSLAANFTNECGINKTIRFLKNICGLWLIQEAKKAWAKEGLDLSYDEIEARAARAEDKFRLDPNADRFLNPDNMVQEIKDYCRDSGQPVPENYGELARGIYESLAQSYREVIEKLEDLVNTDLKQLNVVGGGVRDELLSKFTARTTGRRVVTGPVEATALGNIMVQLMAGGEISDLREGREVIRRSFSLEVFTPED